MAKKIQRKNVITFMTHLFVTIVFTLSGVFSPSGIMFLAVD